MRKWIANGRLVRNVRISLAGKISSTPVNPQNAGRMKTQGIKKRPWRRLERNEAFRRWPMDWKVILHITFTARSGMTSDSKRSARVPMAMASASSMKSGMRTGAKM